jgi:hypothetical protein
MRPLVVTGIDLEAQDSGGRLRRIQSDLLASKCWRLSTVFRCMKPLMLLQFQTSTFRIDPRLHLSWLRAQIAGNQSCGRSTRLRLGIGKPHWLIVGPIRGRDRVSRYSSAILENRFHHAAVHPQRRTIGGRRKLAGHVGHHCRNFIHSGKALQ